jgi:hypothetical protein
MAKTHGPDQPTNPFGLPEKKGAYPYLWASTRSFHRRMRHRVNQGRAGWVLVFALALIGITILGGLFQK